MPHPIAAPINQKALAKRARDIRAWLGGFLKWALRELSRPSAMIPRLLIDGAPALRVAERELRELILCEALSRFPYDFPRRDARGVGARLRARPPKPFDPRNAPRGFCCARARMSATRQLTRGVLPKLNAYTPYARAERLARVSESIEFYAEALLARLKSGAHACSLIISAPPVPALFSNAPRPARAAADTS